MQADVSVRSFDCGYHARVLRSSNWVSAYCSRSYAVSWTMLSIYCLTDQLWRLLPHDYLFLLSLFPFHWPSNPDLRLRIQILFHQFTGIFYVGRAGTCSGAKRTVDSQRNKGGAWGNTRGRRVFRLIPWLVWGFKRRTTWDPIPFFTLQLYAMAAKMSIYLDVDRFCKKKYSPCWLAPAWLFLWIKSKLRQILDFRPNCFTKIIHYVMLCWQD